MVYYKVTINSKYDSVSIFFPNANSLTSLSTGQSLRKTVASARDSSQSTNDTA
uniref:Uncharacterized protein n=1 Tax=Anguilla anguilla TaxID=7936 RepID=A0A0E9UV32_ANGAN